MIEYDEQSTRMRVHWIREHLVSLFWLMILQTVILVLILWRVW